MKDLAGRNILQFIDLVEVLDVDHEERQVYLTLSHFTSITGYIGTFGGHLGQFSAFWLCSCLCKLLSNMLYQH